MNAIPKLLSKTKLLRGYRCQRCIYLTIHQPRLEAPISPETQALFDQGNTVGAKAREYYPGGVLIDNKPWDFTGALQKTRALLANGTPIIYEAAFAYQGCYARADIIQYSPQSQRFRIFEVKATTKVKPEHYDDLALQVWIMTKSGLPIEQINLVHLNPDCRYPDLSQLFKAVDVTAILREHYLTVKPKIKEIITTLQQTDAPAAKLGPYCLQPTECGFKNHCWQQQIPALSIMNLPQLSQRKWELYQQGIIALDDERLTQLNELQERIVACFKTGERYLDKASIRAARATWQYPYTFLDFETINPAIPRYHGCRPFEHIPFQFSAHVYHDLNAEGVHHAFLHDTTADPRPQLIPALLAACGEHGSIIAYYARFEKERIQALADYAPQYKAALLQLLPRFVDPLDLIRAAVYDNAFNGSFSLKSVAPALLGKDYSYEGMLVANGSDAQRAFEELIFTDSVARKTQLKEALLAYCKQDTAVMVALIKWLDQVTMDLQ